MASYTTNLNLKKPAGSENVAIGDINNNMDTIDQAYGTLNSKFTTIEDVKSQLSGSTINSANKMTFGKFVIYELDITLTSAAGIGNSIVDGLARPSATRNYMQTFFAHNAVMNGHYVISICDNDTSGCLKAQEAIENGQRLRMTFMYISN